MDRIDREKTVVSQMITIYCRKHHNSTDGKLCPDCTALLSYALRRLDLCPKGNRKTSCRKCGIHCYAPVQRDHIRKVMKYVGPRMILYHPLSALRHLISELK